MQLSIGKLTRQASSSSLALCSLGFEGKSGKNQGFVWIHYMSDAQAKQPPLFLMEISKRDCVRKCARLDVAISAFSKNRSVVMPKPLVVELTWLARLHSACYQWLAVRCLQQQRLLYKIRPKMHYYARMIDTFLGTSICLTHLSTFGGEDLWAKPAAVLLKRATGALTCAHGRDATP